jgi:hypothetical protein
MTAAAPVLVVTGDLFFRAKIEATARALGIPLTVVAAANVPAAAAFGGCIVDLDSVGAGALPRVAELAAAHPTVGFLSHVNVELAQRARAAGCADVLPRSRFSAELPQILARLHGSAS